MTFKKSKFIVIFIFCLFKTVLTSEPGQSGSSLSDSHHSLFYLHPNKLYDKLPTVRIVNLPPKFNVDVPNYSNKTIFGLENFGYHEQDLKFILWLKQYYSKTVNDSNNVDLYYLHIYHDFMMPLPPDWFYGINSELQKISENEPPLGFQMDKVFMVVTHPLVWVSELHRSLRCLFGIRFIRVDPECSFNGREVFVPYVEPKSIWRHQISVVKRLFFIAAACREAYGHLDFTRQWRGKLFNSWGNVPDCIISKNLNASQFDEAYLQSDFCAILPGDTTSTAKLYKAIFAGCIPIIFLSFPSELPFFHIIDWSQFSIIVAKDILNSVESMNELLIYLKIIREDVAMLKKYKIALEGAGLLFDYSRSDWPSVYHLTLLELMRNKQKKASVAGHLHTLSHKLKCNSSLNSFLVDV
jgi:hypothetical protein